MTENGQLRALEALREWSKWLIGVAFTAATGCVIVLQGGVPPVAQLALVLAITAFTLGVLCSALLLRALASLAEHLPVSDSRGIDGQPAWIGLTIGQIARAQLLCLSLGALCFLGWIVAPLILQ